MGHHAPVAPAPLQPGGGEAPGDAVQARPLPLHHGQLRGGAVLQPDRGPDLEVHLLRHLLVDAHHDLAEVEGAVLLGGLGDLQGQDNLLADLLVAIVIKVLARFSFKLFILYTSSFWNLNAYIITAECFAFQ